MGVSNTCVDYSRDIGEAAHAIERLHQTIFKATFTNSGIQGSNHGIGTKTCFLYKQITYELSC